MTEQTRVIVAGDWLVDEYWVVGPHRSQSSSRTGATHSRALQEGAGSVQSLCGAGQVATILHQATKNDRPANRIVGIGIWHPGDDEELKWMLNPAYNTRLNPHHLTRREPTEDEMNPSQ